MLIRQWRVCFQFISLAKRATFRRGHGFQSRWSHLNFSHVYWIRDNCSRIYWPMKISNEVIRNRANISTISEQIFQWRCKFIGHVLRMDPNKHPKTALTCAPEGRRSRGRPKAENRRKRKNSIGFYLMERGNSGCRWLCDMAKESVWPYTPLRVMVKIDWIAQIVQISERITSTFHSFYVYVPIK